VGGPVPGQGPARGPIAGTAQNTPHDYLFGKALMEAITSDPGFAEGEYESNAARPIRPLTQKDQLLSIVLAGRYG
jgi:homoserine acetyltransferase